MQNTKITLCQGAMVTLVDLLEIAKAISLQLIDKTTYKRILIYVRTLPIFKITQKVQTRDLKMNQVKFPRQPSIKNPMAGW